jgi:PAS domain S-box-containing protein
MSPEISERATAILDLLARMAKGDLDLTIPISPERDLLDAFAFGINMLTAELRYTTIYRDELVSVFDSVPEMVIVVDRGGTIVQVNQAVLDHAGGTSDGWIGRSWSSLFDAGTTLFGDLVSLLRAGERLADLPWTTRSTDGSRIPVMVSATALRDRREKSNIVLVAKDMRATYELIERKAEIVAERRRTSELQRARDLAEEATRAKSTFLANVSHELRTPLTVVLSGAELLSRPDLKAEVRDRCLGQVQISARRLRSLVNDLLDSAKVESGNLVISHENLALWPVFEEVYATYEPGARAKGVKLCLVRDGTLPRTVETDPLRFHQILDNLLGNALKFTSQGEVTLRVAVQGGTSLEVSVADSGIGIPPEQQGRLFRPFSQADDRVSQSYGGTGLGLALSRNLAHLLGGELRLAWSEQGRGSCFVLTLPVSRAA